MLVYYLYTCDYMDSLSNLTRSRLTPFSVSEEKNIPMAMILNKYF